MTDCERFIEQVSALVDAELSPDEEAAVLAHIEKCPDCAGVYDTFTDIADCLTRMSVEPPENLKRSVMCSIKNQAKASRKPMSSFFRYAGLAAVFALVILVTVNSPTTSNSDNGADRSAVGAMKGGGGGGAAGAEEADVAGTVITDIPDAGVSGLRNPDMIYSAQSLSDIQCFSNYLETIPSAEYEDAVDDYEGELYAVLVLEGDLPDVLDDTDKLLENKSEVYLEVSKDEIESLCENSDGSWLIMNDESADKGIVIIKKDEG